MGDIQYSRNTIGCKIGTEVFVHPELYTKPELYKAILLHESRHSDSFMASDMGLDIFNKELKGHKKDFYLFILTHPRTLLGFLPFTKIGKHWVFDLELTLAWMMAIGFIWYIGAHL